MVPPTDYKKNSSLGPVYDGIIWRNIHISNPAFWWSLLIQYGYYSTRTFLPCIILCVIVLTVNYAGAKCIEKGGQFIIVKKTGCALKQRSKAHSSRRQRMSQLQKHQTARMPIPSSNTSGRAQKVCSWNGVVTRWRLDNITKMRLPTKCAAKLSFLYYVAVKYTTTREAKPIRACLSRYAQSGWTTIVTKLDCVPVHMLMLLL